MNKSRASRHKSLFILFILLTSVITFIPIIQIPEVEAALLSGWGKRVKITIDQNDIDDDLTNFPVLIYLGSSSGRGNDDVTFVFDEVGEHYQKIAITESDGTTELYVEVEEWDSSGEEAWLWVKVPTITSASDTDIYLYFNGTHANNTAYVGGCADGSAATEAVWSEDYEAVYHMVDATTSTILDSTSNDYDGAKIGAGTPTEVSGIIGPAQDFDGSEEIDLDAYTGTYTTVTMEIWFNSDDFSDIAYLYMLSELDENLDRVMMWGGPNLLYHYYRTDGVTVNPSIAFTDTTNWHYFASTRNSTTIKGYVNGTVDANLDGVVGVGTIQDLVANWIGCDVSGIDNFWDGMLDEARFSSVNRSAAWIKATYETGMDDLLDWGTEEWTGIRNQQIIASNSTPAYEQPFSLNVSVEVQPNIGTYLTTRIDIDPTGLNLSCSYVNSTDTFVEENDPNNYLQLDSVVSAKLDENSTNVRIDFNITIHSNITKFGYYDVGVFSTSSGYNDSDTFSLVFYLPLPDPSWLSGWSYRKRIDINGSTAGDLTDYQVLLKAYYSEGVYTFAEDGVDEPLYTANYPRAVYYNGVTYALFQGGAGYDPYIVAYNHTAKTWTGPVQVGTNPLAGDYHGAPSLMIDNASRLHIFFGSHQTASEYVKSDNPEDITAWTAKADIPGALTYPNSVYTDDGTAYLIIREGDADGRDLVYFKSTDNGDSWGAETEIISVIGAESDAIYAYSPQLNGTRLHIIWRSYIVADGMHDLFHAYLNLTDNHMYNITGTDLGVSISSAEADASCRIVDSLPFSVNHMALRLDENGYPYIIYNAETATAFDFNFTRWSGTEWISPVNITQTDSLHNNMDFILHSSTSITAFLVDDGLAGRGGDIVEWSWDGSTWSEVRTILSQIDAGMPLVSPKVVVDYVDEIRFIFTEFGGPDVTGLKVYASGNLFSADSGISVYLNESCRTDFGDIRFTSYDGVSLLDYWLERETDSESALFWAEVDVIPEYPDNGTIYMYYGKASATSISDGFATFVDFDDFNNNSLNAGWTVDNASAVETIVEENQEVHLHHRMNTFNHIEKSMTSDNVVARARLKRVDNEAEASWALSLVYYFNQYDYAEIILGAEDKKVSADWDKDEVYGGTASAANAWVVGTYEYVRMRVTSDNVYFDYSLNGEDWTFLTSTARPVTWISPTLIIIGHGIERSAGSYPNADFDNSGVAGVEFETYADDYIIRKYTLSEPSIVGWGSEEESENVSPTITSASISDMDTTDNCYKMESYYTFTAVVNDGDGATDIASVYLQIKQGANVRVEVRATSLDGAPSYAIQTGATISDLDTGNCAWAEDGDEGTATFKIRFEWDYTDEADIEIAVYVEDTAAASAGFTDKQTDYFDVIGRLVTTGSAAADARIDKGTATTFGGNVYYATTVAGNTASTKYPPDAQFTAVHIHNAAHATQGNDATIVNGAFSGISVTIPDLIQSNNYHIYLDLVADYTDADAPDGDTVAVIGDRLEFVSIAVDDTRVNVGTTFELRYVIRYDHDDVAFDTADGTINGFAWDAINSWWDKTVTGETTVTTTNYDETYLTITDTTYGLTIKEDEAGVDVITTRAKLLTLTSSQEATVAVDTPVIYYATAEDEYDNHAWGTGDTFSLADVPFTWVTDKFISSEQKYSTDGAVLTLDSFTAASEATYGIDETGANMNGLSFTTTWGVIVIPSGPIAPSAPSAPSVTYEGVIIDDGGGIIITPTPKPFNFGTLFDSITRAAIENAPIILLAGVASIFLIPGVVEEREEEKIEKLKKPRAHRKDKGKEKTKVVRRKRKKAKEFV